MAWGPKPTILYSNWAFIKELYLPLPSGVEWTAEMSKKPLGRRGGSRTWTNLVKIIWKEIYLVMFTIEYNQLFASKAHASESWCSPSGRSCKSSSGRLHPGLATVGTAVVATSHWLAHLRNCSRLHPGLATVGTAVVAASHWLAHLRNCSDHPDSWECSSEVCGRQWSEPDFRWGRLEGVAALPKTLWESSGWALSAKPWEDCARCHSPTESRLLSKGGLTDPFHGWSPLSTQSLIQKIHSSM